MESQRWDSGRVRALQERLLRRLLTHAAQTSPWYRARLGNRANLEAFALDDLWQLPILEKADLQAHLDEISGPGRLARGVSRASSSGSTGTPVSVYQSAEHRDWYAAGRERSYLMCAPFRLGARRVFFWGTDLESTVHRGVAGTVRDTLVNMLWFDAFSLRRDGLPAAIRRVREFRPALVVGYVSTMTEVAAALERPVDGLEAVETAAETLTAPQRTLIEKAFGAPVFDRYTTREVGTIAHECEVHDGLHLLMENSIVELVGPDGRPVSQPGDEGEVVVTSLRNLATPMIRYRLGDIARLGRDGCACGRSSVRLESVIGRTGDLIVSPRGVLLHGLFFMRLFDASPVKRFRVDQETRSRLRIRVVPGDRYTDAVRETIVERIHRLADPGFEVEWETVPEIPYTASGKFRFTVSHIGAEESGKQAEQTLA